MSEEPTTGSGASEIQPRLPVARNVKRPLAANADAPWKARRLVARAGEHLPHRLVDRATLVASELVSNAVEHGSREAESIWFGVSADEDELTITVADRGPSTAAPATKTRRHRMSHYGLQILRQMADRWNIDAGPRWTVSATFTRRSPTTAT